MSIVLNDVTNLQKLSTINDNFDKIEAAMNDDILWRNGDTVGENQMNSQIDMNGHRITSMAPGQNGGDAVNVGQFTGEEPVVVIPASEYVFSFATQEAASLSENMVEGDLFQADGLDASNDRDYDVVGSVVPLGSGTTKQYFDIGVVPYAQGRIIISGALNIKKFGAVEGDAASIRDAIHDGIATGYKSIYIPPGTWELEDIIISDAGVTIYGDYQASTIVCTSTHAISLHAQRFTLTNFLVDCGANGLVSAVNSGYGGSDSLTHKGTFANLTIFGDYPLVPVFYFEGHFKDFQIINVTGEGGGGGTQYFIHLNATFANSFSRNIAFHNINITNFAGLISTEGYTISWVDINNCFVSSASDKPTKLYNCLGLKIVNLHCTGCTDAADIWMGGSGSSSAGQSSVSDSTFETSFGPGVRFLGCREGQISGIMSMGNDGPGIIIGGSGTDKFRGTFSDIVSVNNEYGILISSDEGDNPGEIEEVHFTGIRCSGNDKDGVMMAGDVGDIYFRNSIITNNGLVSAGSENAAIVFSKNYGGLSTGSIDSLTVDTTRLGNAQGTSYEDYSILVESDSPARITAKSNHFHARDVGDPEIELRGAAGTLLLTNNTVEIPNKPLYATDDVGTLVFEHGNHYSNAVGIPDSTEV